MNNSLLDKKIIFTEILKVLWKGRRKRKTGISGKWNWKNRDGASVFCHFSLLFLVAKFSNPIWPGPLFHVKQHFWIIFFLLSVFLFNVSRETIVNWNNVSLWIGRWWYEFVIRLFVCVYNLWVALFWDFGIRSWRNFLLFFIAVIEFEDADFFLLKVADSVISLCLTVE